MSRCDTIGDSVMTAYTLQDVLAFIDDDKRFLRWVAEMEQPGPWRHKWTDRPLDHCAKCGKQLFQDGQALVEYGSPCSVPDPLTKSLPEIVQERIKGTLDHIYLIEGILRIMVEIERARECTNFGDAIIMAYEWFIRAGAKRQYVVLCFAEGKVK